MSSINNMLELNKAQKETIGLLSVGTFLEYFDLMLYVHMAVLLNELFFPKTDSHNANLISALAFCSTFVFRPIGAFIFGWIGDNIGRKITVVITTAMMALSCIIMAALPTYAQIGITASWIVTICRIVQGMSSLGEIVGAELYVTEITKPPIQYPAVSLITISASLGTIVALSIAFIVTSTGFNWRMAFWIGALIALVGAAARTKLRETPEFADAKRNLRRTFEQAHLNKKKLEESPIWKEKVNIKTSISLFLIQCTWPVFFYLAYIYCGHILKYTFEYTPSQIIYQNLIVAILEFVFRVIIAYLSYRIYPLTIIKVKILLTIIFIPICPYLLNNVHTPFELLLIQFAIILASLSYIPAMPILFKHLPIFKRFTYAALAHALSRTIMSIATSFGIVYLVKYFGNWGVLVIMLPTSIGFIFGIYHFNTLENNSKKLSL